MTASSASRKPVVAPEHAQFFKLLDRALAMRYARAIQSRKPSSQSSIIFKPRMDVLDNSQNPKIVAALELPGLKKEEISLRIQDGSLVVWGERRSRLAPEGSVAAETHATQELRYGKFRRVIALPKGSQTSEISASMAEGMLTITWPREPAASIVEAA